jgi:hypothetical protein
MLSAAVGRFTLNPGGSLPRANVWCLTEGVLLCFSTTRFYGALLSALLLLLIHCLH